MSSRQPLICDFGSMEEQHARVRRLVQQTFDGDGVIHWTPNRFLQFTPKDNSVHLNMWGDPVTGAPPGYSPVHTHDYGFTSRTIFGSLINVLCDVAETPAGSWEKYQIFDEYGDNSYDEFRSTGIYCDILRSRITESAPGSIYAMDPRDWHITLASAPTITLLDMWRHKPVPYFTLGPKNHAYQTSDRRVKPEQLPEIFAYTRAMMKLAGISI